MRMDNTLMGFSQRTCKKGPNSIHQKCTHVLVLVTSFCERQMLC